MIRCETSFNLVHAVIYIVFVFVTEIGGHSEKLKPKFFCGLGLPRRAKAHECHEVLMLLYYLSAIMNKEIIISQTDMNRYQIKLNK